MSLWEKGGGILDTHVTWSDIVQVLQQEGHYCQFGENIKITDIGAGNGFLSKIALIEPDWQDNSGGLPRKLIVKICSQLAQIELDPSSRGNTDLEQKFRETHNFEASVYQTLEKHRRSGFPVPKVFAARLFSDENLSKGFIVMEFIENPVIHHVVKNLDEDCLSQGLSAIVELIGITKKLTPQEHTLFPKNLFENLCGSYFTPELVSSQTLAVRDMLGDQNRDLVDVFVGMSRRRMTLPGFREMDELPDTLGMTRVLSHGDLWSTNILWKEEDNRFQLAAIIDFQSIHMGSVATDFVTFVCSCMSGIERRQRFYQLQLEFYTKVCEKFTKPPFSLEEFLEACKRVFPFCGYNIATTMASIYPGLQNQGKEVPEFSQVAEKVKYLVEDIVAYDQETGQSGM